MSKKHRNRTKVKFHLIYLPTAVPQLHNSAKGVTYDEQSEWNWKVVQTHSSCHQNPRIHQNSKIHQNFHRNSKTIKNPSKFKIQQHQPNNNNTNNNKMTMTVDKREGFDSSNLFWFSPDMYGLLFFHSISTFLAKNSNLMHILRNSESTIGTCFCTQCIVCLYFWVPSIS